MLIYNCINNKVLSYAKSFREKWKSRIGWSIR